MSAVLLSYFYNKRVEIEYHDRESGAVAVAYGIQMLDADEGWIVFKDDNQGVWALRTSDVTYIRALPECDNPLKDDGQSLPDKSGSL